MSPPPGRQVGNEPGHATAATPLPASLNCSAHVRPEALWLLAAMLCKYVRFINIEILFFLARTFRFPARQLYINSTEDIVNTFFVYALRPKKLSGCFVRAGFIV